MKFRWCQCDFVGNVGESSNVLVEIRDMMSSLVKRVESTEKELKGLHTSSTKKEIPHSGSIYLALHIVFNYQ